MSDELDRRAALAMGWKEYTQESTDDKYWVNGGDVLRLVESWSPSTDRNDLSELLREVEQRGMEFDLDRAFEFPSIAAAFGIDAAKLCEAACEVLEAENEQK